MNFKQARVQHCLAKRNQLFKLWTFRICINTVLPQSSWSVSRMYLLQGAKNKRWDAGMPWPQWQLARPLVAPIPQRTQHCSHLARIWVWGALSSSQCQAYLRAPPTAFCFLLSIFFFYVLPQGIQPHSVPATAGSSIALDVSLAHPGSPFKPLLLQLGFSPQDGGLFSGK
jgi:hypothetical protein